MAELTPEPWKLEKHATMPNGVTMFWVNRNTSIGTKVEADAVAMAAAPDLLEALADMLSEFDADEFGSEGQMQTCAKARAAIARARGES